jgi:hypothetical protein
MINNDLVYSVKELNVDMINPTTKDFMDPTSSATKTIVIGKPGTGKC